VKGRCDEIAGCQDSQEVMEQSMCEKNKMGRGWMQSIIIIITTMCQKQYAGGVSMDNRDVWMRN
jgi:hypothetical protein